LEFIEILGPLFEAGDFEEHFQIFCGFPRKKLTWLRNPYSNIALERTLSTH
jgi:hypothetical protein